SVTRASESDTCACLSDRPDGLVSLQMADGQRLFTQMFVQLRQIEMRVRVRRLVLDRRFVRGRRFLEAGQVFERDAEVEVRGGVLWIHGERQAIVHLGQLELLALVQQAAEVDAS